MYRPVEITFNEHLALLKALKPGMRLIEKEKPQSLYIPGVEIEFVVVNTTQGEAQNG